MPKGNKEIDEKALTKGELRKLNALRKSIGDKLADEAFTKWLARKDVGEDALDPNPKLIEKALQPLMNKVRIPRGGAYAIRRGRGRFIVEPIDLTT